MSDSKDGTMGDEYREIIRRLDVLRDSFDEYRKEEHAKHDAILIEITELKTREKIRSEREVFAEHTRDEDEKGHEVEHNKLWEHQRKTRAMVRNILLVAATVMSIAQGGWMVYSHFTKAAPAPAAAYPRASQGVSP
jgi:hypothetical protein